MQFFPRLKQLLSPEQTHTYFERLQTGDTDAREHLIKMNLPLVINIVNQFGYVGTQIDRADMEQEGCVALIKAVDTFDLNKGTRFSTYATTFIKTELVKFVNKTAAVTIPQNLRYERRLLIRKSKELTEKLGHTPSVEELAEATNRLPKQVDILLQAGYEAVMSLDTPIRDRNLTIEDTLCVDEQVSIEDEVIARLSALELDEVLDTLDDRNKEIVRLRYGFVDGIEHSGAEIGRRMGLSRQRIHKRIEKSLAELATIVTVDVNVEIPH